MAREKANMMPTEQTSVSDAWISGAIRKIFKFPSPRSSAIHLQLKNDPRIARAETAHFVWDTPNPLMG
jgi:hypothetical protein